MSRQQLALEAVLDDGRKAILRNQTAWFMREVISHGERGLTKADYPGLHVGDIVMRIRRKLGKDVILTEMEPNSHGWGGEHGRYRLNAEIKLTEVPAKKKPAKRAGQNSNISTVSDEVSEWE